MFKFYKLLAICSSFLLLTPLTLQAQNNNLSATTVPASSTTTNKSPIAQPPAINARGYVLIDANSGEILAQNNPDMKMPPASLTKVMTMYVISFALKNGKIHLDDLAPISKTAWKTGGSRMFVREGTQVPVNELINGIVVASGNDAAVAMAEYIAGSEDNFVSLMNQTAEQLGMKNSHFEDVNGLPAPDHYTTPRDLAILAQALIEDFPDYYKAWYSQKSFEFNKIKQNNRNQLLWKDPSVDGIKTGHTDAAGYCLIASAQRNDMRLISVVLGAPSPKARIDGTEALLNWGFRHYSSHQLYAANQPLIQARVWFGKNKEIPLGVQRGLYVTIPNGRYKNLKAFLTLNSDLEAPISKGKPYGKVEVTLDNQPLTIQPIVALENNPTGNIFRRLTDQAIRLFEVKG